LIVVNVNVVARIILTDDDVTKIADKLAR